MRHRSLVVLALIAFVAPELPGQATGKKAATSRAKSILGQIADTAVTSAASLATDTLLGDKAGMVAALIGADGSPTCAAGLIAVPAQYAGVPGAGAAMPGVPSAGSALVGLAKKKIAGAKAAAATDAAAAVAGGVPGVPANAAASAPQYMCGTPDQVSAAMQAAQTAGATGAPGIKSTMGAALAATPQGALVGGAVAAAPMAGAAAKKLGGMFGRGGQTAASMKKDLAKGRLTIKKIKFVEGSDEMAPGFEEQIALLAEALQGTEGSFAVAVTPESDGANGADVELADRRTQRVFAHLLVSGIPPGRVVTRSGGKPVKRGEARVELVTSGGESEP